MQISEDEDWAAYSRSYTVKISAKEIAQSIADASERAMREQRLPAPTIRMPGFRPGKVPANLIRKINGYAIEHDALNQAVQEGVQEILADLSQRPSGTAKGKGKVDLGSARDVEIRVALDVLPAVPKPHLGELRLTRPRVEIRQEDVAAEAERLAREDRDETTPSGRGSRARRGAEANEQQREARAKATLEERFDALSRSFLKRQLLDRLAETNDFPVPPWMVDAEFAQIWQQLQHEATDEADPAAALAELENDKDQYKAIAERRVRLGLLLSEIGQANSIEVSQAEMQRLVAQAAQQYQPKDRERFAQYIQQDPMAAAQLRAPLYEDKVVDWLLNKASITDRTVERSHLEEALEADDPTSYLNRVSQSIDGAASDTMSALASVESEQALDKAARIDFLREAAEAGPAPAIYRPALEQQTRQAALEILGSATVLGRAIDGDEDLAEAINAGFPSEVINRLREAGWSPGVLESVIAPKRTLMRRKSVGQRLSPAESDAAWRLAYILGLASTVLSGRKAAISWLSRPKLALHRHMPLELLRSSVGTSLIAALLRRLDDGNLA